MKPRFTLLVSEAIRIKFRLDSALFGQCYKDLLQSKVSNFLYEERRRDERKVLRERQRQLKVRVLNHPDKKLCSFVQAQLNENDRDHNDDEEDVF